MCAGVEVIRLIFEELGIEYQERHVIGDDWQALKPKTPFGGLPIYQEGDLVLVQSRAIFRYLARKHGLYGSTEADQAQCDIVAEAIDDAEVSLWRWLCDADPEEKRAAFAGGELSMTLGRLQKWFRRNGDGAQFWVGDSMTYADFMAFAYLDEVRAFFPETLAQFPALHAFYDRVAARRRIAAYLKSPRYLPDFGYGPRGRIKDPAFAPHSR
ncbi:MAG TPA: glutathione S-transferase family protein [Candidatus Binataceae bacterium]|nr:glutathione S-transferase family protein [Candidatus Binataceae bacterium]